MADFDAAVYRRRCLASGWPPELVDEIVEDAQARADAAALLARCRDTTKVEADAIFARIMAHARAQT